MIDKPDLTLDLSAFQLSHDIFFMERTFNISDRGKPNGTRERIKNLRIALNLSQTDIEKK